MKKRILVLTMVAMLAVMLISLAACGDDATLEGTFTDAFGVSSYVFSDGLATLNMGGMELFSESFEVRDGNLYIAGERIGTVSGDTITIEGVEYTKE